AVAEEPVDDGRRAPRRRFAFEVGGEPLGVGPAVIRLVAADTGDRAGPRPALVPEELLAERDLLGRGWVVIGYEGRLLLEPERQLELLLGALSSDGRDDKNPDDQCQRSFHGTTFPPSNGRRAGRAMSLRRPTPRVLTSSTRPRQPWRPAHPARTSRRIRRPRRQSCR